MADRRTIPAGVIGVVAEEVGNYFTHARLNALFFNSGAPQDAPELNKIDKCSAWLGIVNRDPTCDPLAVLSGVIGEYLEADPDGPTDSRIKGQKRIHKALARGGLAYADGRVAVVAPLTGPTRSLEAVLRARDLPSVEKEFTRALANVETDPAAAVTAACAVIESFCRIHIEDHKLALPAVQDLGGLWKVVRKDMKLDSVGDVADDDIKKVLGGLASIADGVASLRTHAGSAHGKGRAPFKLAPRHARLAVHAAHTLVVYLVERADSVRK